MRKLDATAYSTIRLPSTVVNSESGMAQLYDSSSDVPMFRRNTHLASIPEFLGTITCCWYSRCILGENNLCFFWVGALLVVLATIYR